MLQLERKIINAVCISHPLFVVIFSCLSACKWPHFHENKGLTQKEEIRKKKQVSFMRHFYPFFRFLHFALTVVFHGKGLMILNHEIFTSVKHQRSICKKMRII